MTSWLAAKLEQSSFNKDSFSQQRQAALDLLAKQQWPGRKTEAWKYLSLFPLDQLASGAGQDNLPKETSYVGMNEKVTGDAINLELEQGCLKEFPGGLPAGLTITSSSLSDIVPAWAKAQYATIKPGKHLFGLVNDVYADDIIMVHVDKGVAIEKPLHIIQKAVSDETHTRILVRLEEGASLKLCEISTGINSGFSTCFSECDLENSAQLEHYRFVLNTRAAMHIGGFHVNLHDKAVLNSTLVGFGSQLSRLDMDVNHIGEFAEAKINAIYLLDEEETFDLHTCIEHAMPNGTTEENVRGIVAEKGKAVFNGRIHIHRDAQKTLAELNNRNLLLSRGAEVYTKPELEIYADDVRCAHGATVAEIDKKQLYYLLSRGIDKQQAMIMLNFGFINELVDQMPDQQLAEWLRPQLRQRFAGMKQEV